MGWGVNFWLCTVLMNPSWTLGYCGGLVKSDSGVCGREGVCVSYAVMWPNIKSDMECVLMLIIWYIGNGSRS